MEDDALSTISTLSNTTLTDVNERTTNGEIDDEIDDIYKMVTSITYNALVYYYFNIIPAINHKQIKVSNFHFYPQIGRGPTPDTSQGLNGGNAMNCSPQGNPASR